MTLDGAIWHLVTLSLSFILPWTAQDASKPKFRLTRTHVYGEKKDTWSIDPTTDGKEHYQKDGDFETRSRLYWEGSSLILMKLRNKAEEGTNVVRYSLTDGGRT